MTAHNAAQILNSPWPTLPRVAHWLNPDNYLDPWSAPEFARIHHRTPPKPQGREPTLQERLDRVNTHFRFKAAEVYADDDALRLLATLYEAGLIELRDFDLENHAIPLAKLTAANFAQVFHWSIQITEPGQHFINQLLKL